MRHAHSHSRDAATRRGNATAAALVGGVAADSRAHVELAAERTLWPLSCSRLVSVMANFLGPEDCVPFATAMCASLWSSLPGTERAISGPDTTSPMYTASFAQKVTAAQAAAVLRAHLTLVRLYRIDMGGSGGSACRGRSPEHEATAALAMLSSASTEGTEQQQKVAAAPLPTNQLAAVQSIDSALLRFFDISGAAPSFAMAVRTEVAAAAADAGAASSSSLSRKGRGASDADGGKGNNGSRNSSRGNSG